MNNSDERRKKIINRFYDTLNEAHVHHSRSDRFFGLTESEALEVYMEGQFIGHENSPR